MRLVYPSTHTRTYRQDQRQPHLESMSCNPHFCVFGPLSSLRTSLKTPIKIRQKTPLSIFSTLKSPRSSLLNFGVRTLTRAIGNRVHARLVKHPHSKLYLRRKL